MTGIGGEVVNPWLAYPTHFISALIAQADSHHKDRFFVSLITRLTTHDQFCALSSSNRQALQLGRSADLPVQHRRSQTFCAVNRHGAGYL